MRAPTRAVTVALVPAGTVAGHALGYLMAGQDAALRGAHSHLRPAAWIAAAVLATALAGVAVARPTAGSSRRPRVCWLVAGQVLAFGALEAVEHLRSGHQALSFVADPSFRWGVVAQLVSAAVLVAAAGLARTSGQRVRAFLLRRRPPARRTEVRRSRPAPRTEVRRPASSSAVSERGPPRLLAPA